MTLKEKAFMLDLINCNFRRRTIFSIFETVLIFGGLGSIFVINMLLTITIVSVFITILGVISFLVGIFLILFCHKPFGLKELSPRGIKEAQLKALKQHANADFEELIHSVPLKEYFEA
jgi:hypothetical protein